MEAYDTLTVDQKIIVLNAGAKPGIPTPHRNKLLELRTSHPFAAAEFAQQYAPILAAELAYARRCEEAAP